MGKRITLYLTAQEMEMIEKICAKDGEGPNMSRTLKKGLTDLFQRCVFVPEHPHDGVSQAMVYSEQAVREMTPNDEYSKVGLRKEKCSKCETWNLYPDETAMLKWNPEKLKAEGLKKYRCSECGKEHLTPIDNIVIQESPMEKEKRLKLEKARAEAEKFIKSATDPIDKMFREGFAGQRLKKALREVDE